MENKKKSYEPSDGGAVQVTERNFDSLLASNELTIILFYSKWYPKSLTYLKPTFDKTAEELIKVGYAPGKVVLGKVNLDQEEALKSKCNIYTGISLYRKGLLVRKYFQGILSLKTIEDELSDPIVTFCHLNELEHLSENKTHAIIFLNNKDQPEYEVLREVATILKDEIVLHVGFCEAPQELNLPTGQLSIVLRSQKGTLVELDEVYNGSLLDLDNLCSWIREKCFPLLHVLTYDTINTPHHGWRPQSYIMLVHKTSDTQSVRKYKHALRKELVHRKDELYFYIADGERFEELMLRLNRSTSDLPIIVIEYSLSFVSLFDYKDIETPGKLKEFVNVVKKGELYRQAIYLGHLKNDLEEDYHISDLFE